MIGKEYIESTVKREESQSK